MEQKQPLKNATITLALGILSIVVSCVALGLILALVGLLISKQSKILYEKNPESYYGWGNLKAGRIMCIIGLVFSVISILYYVLAIIISGSILAGLFNLAK